MTSTDNLPPELWTAWRSFVEQRFGLALTETSLGQYRVYLRELIAWNELHNLVSFRSAGELLWRHFADSLAGNALLPAGPLNVIDLGAGAGFPGIPLKIARPDMRLTLVESITKKCAFLEHILQTLSMAGTAVLNTRAELLGQEAAHREKYDVVVSRAMAKLSPNLENSLPLARKGGKALIYKTEKTALDPAERTAAECVSVLLGGRPGPDFCYTIPNEELGYCVISFDKVEATPAKYPRRPGMPEKRPL